MVSQEPLYWKARNLDVFTNTAWTTRSEPLDPQGEELFTLDMPEDWQQHAGVDERHRGLDPADADRRRDRRGDDRRRQGRVAVGRAGHLARDVGRAGPAAARRLLHRRRARPEADAGAARGRDLGRVPAPARTRPTITVPYKPGEVQQISRSAASIIAKTKAGPITAFEVRFKPWDGVGSDRVDYPGTNRSDFDVDAQMKRSQYARTWALSKELKRDTDRPMDYVRKVYDYLHRPEFRYVERPAQPPAGRRAAGVLHQPDARGLLPALRGRDGAAAAHGRRPGARRHRLLARRLLGAQEGLDRARHRRARLGRGVVRQVRLDHDRPDAGRHARPLAGRRAGARAGRGAARRRGRHRRLRRRGQHRARRTSRCARSCRSAAPTRSPNAGTQDGGIGFWVWALGVLGAGRRRARRAAVPAPPAREDADGPGDQRGRERAGARRPAGQRRHDDDAARAPARLALARGRGLPARAGGGALRALAAATTARGPAGAAARAGAGARVRRRAARAVGAAAADRAGRADRPRTFEVETSVRVRG